MHSSGGTGAVGSASAEVSRPISCSNINIEQLNQTNAAQRRDNLTALVNTPPVPFTVAQPNLMSTLQNQMQQQSNEQVNLQINTSLQSAPSTPPCA